MIYLTTDCEKKLLYYKHFTTFLYILYVNKTFTDPGYDEHG